MNALRSSSAFARRSLTLPAAPPAPLSVSSRLLSSSSSISSKRSISSVSLARPQRLATVSRWSGSTPSLYLNQTRTMASETKIKVKNPVVELDGDEVRNLPPFYSSRHSCIRAYHKLGLVAPGGAFSSRPSSNAGKNGVPKPFHVPIHPSQDAAQCHCLFGPFTNGGSSCLYR